MDFPQDFRCPISMELMKDPVTISTGVTYERKNIEKWLFSYKKTTCPTTMQSIDNYTITPNHTVKRLILSWQGGNSHQSSLPPPPPPTRHDEMISLLNTVESTPFKVSSLKKLKSIIEMGDEIKQDFKRNGGVEMVLKIVVQILDENPDFITFRACEEALGVLHRLSLSEEDEKTMKLFSNPDLMKAMAVMLQRGSAEARFYTISIFQKMVMAEFDWSFVIQDQGMDFFKSILELVSDEICTKASSCALQILLEILNSSKKNRLKAIEAGAICILIELLPDSNISKCEKIMELIKLLCECAEGRLGFVEHGLGIAAISKKMLTVSDCATKIGVKILWLICNFHPTERVLEEILVFGGVQKMVALLHIDGRSSTKDKVVKILKLHGSSWRRYTCFPNELKDYLGLGSDSS
ncbi:E3 ubiquitin-protein like [Actinidia chinensis var. chinensis]|uniref:U-box domain-containing protein n=1 Tax=Actinidia chinensis var. chinensis TaxID=1590841 RepID=A0A2R6RAI2_ACTCC|nr:E3 ubiquitin-protein like [Actinidia chinensis var. chinensis]